MMASVDLSFNGGPFEALQSLLDKRVKWIGEERKNATVACMIDVTRSLRADTKTAVYRNRVEISDTGLKPFFDAKRRMWRATSDLRQASKAAVNIRLKYVELHGVPSRNAHVYKVKTEQGKTYYVAARSQSEAVKIERAAAKRRIEKYKGLARTALTVVMSELATSVPPPGKIGSESKRRASSLAKVKVIDRKNETLVSMTSGVDYGKRALKSGSVDLAVKKAANKIAGYLAKAITRNRLSVEVPQTPFPEVRKRK
jgi:hypothetical protein